MVVTTMPEVTAEPLMVKLLFTVVTLVMVFVPLPLKVKLS